MQPGCRAVMDSSLSPRRAYGARCVCACRRGHGAAASNAVLHRRMSLAEAAVGRKQRTTVLALQAVSPRGGA